MTAKPSRTLADLRPNATVHCMVCEQHKPAVGSQKFHRADVCRDCVQKLQAKEQEKKK